MNLDEARQLAIALRLGLEAGSERIEIAGSVRREKPEPHDLELVAIPKVETVNTFNLFGKVEGLECNHFDPQLEALLSRGEWEFDPVLKRNGPKYKRLRHVRTEICADIFLATFQGWGGALAIRTGPADFSTALVTLARRQRKHVADGYLIHSHSKPTRQTAAGWVEYDCPKGSSCPLIISTHDELAFFLALGLPWREPKDRTAEWLWAEAKKKVVA